LRQLSQFPFTELDPVHHYNGTMAGRECYHCKQWVKEGEEHEDQLGTGAE